MAEKKEYIAILDQIDPKNPDKYWFSGQVRTLTLEQAKPLLKKGKIEEYIPPEPKRMVKFISPEGKEEIIPWGEYLRRKRQIFKDRENKLSNLNMEEEIRPTIPKELEPLAEEARKYGSAEEFIENIKQPISIQWETKKGNVTRDVFRSGEELNHFIKSGVPKRIIRTAIVDKPTTPSNYIYDLGTQSLTNFYNQAVKSEIKPAIPAIPKELEPLVKEAHKIAAKYPNTPEGLKAGAEEFGKVFYRLPIVKDISRQGVVGEYSKLVICNIVETRATKLTGAEIYASITNPVGTNDFIVGILKRVGVMADKLGDFYLTPELKILKEKNPYDFNRLIEGKLLFSSEDSALNYLKNIFPSAAYKLDLARNISRNPEFLTDFYNQVVKEVKEVKPAIPKGLEPLKKVEVAGVPKELEKKLETPFRHSTWFQEVRGGKVVPYLTKKEALERLAKMKDVTMYETEKPIPGRPLLAPGEKVFYLTDGKYKYRLSPAEKAYWDKLKALEVKETKEVKPEDSSPNPVTEEEILEIRDWLDKLRKKHKIKPGEWLSDKIVLEELEKEKKKPKIY